MISLRRLLQVGLNKFLGVFDLRIENRCFLNCLEPLLYRIIQEAPEFFFIQIGAYDGVSFDPIHSFVTNNHMKVKGLVLEPMKDAFKELTFNYRKYPGITKLNSAIHNTEKEMTLYRVDPAIERRLPIWSKGIASFNKNHHMRSNMPSENIIEEKVTCISFDELIDKYSVFKIDLLQIDTEGYDYEIISNIDFGRIKPRIIHFEHELQSGTMSKENFTTLVNLLIQHDYLLIVDQIDAIAYQRDLSCGY